MPDMEKVIKGLECCLGSNDCDVEPEEDCPYKGMCLCAMALRLDILALLKEQEARIEQLNRFVNGFSRDAVPVVRCKDCKHYRINTVYPGTNMIMTYCAKTGIAESRLEWFCADGERKE